MLKKRIKVLTAMVAILLIVTAVTATDAKYVGEKSMTFDMNLEIALDENISSAIAKIVNPANITLKMIEDSSNVEISYAQAGDGWIMKLTTKRNADPLGTGTLVCLDPFIDVNLDIATIQALGGYDVEGAGHFGSLDTNRLKYMVVSYYAPATQVPAQAEYNTDAYSVSDFNHLRLYTATSVNEPSRYGSLRFAKMTDAFSSTEANSGSGGKWVTEIIDLEGVNMRGVSQNNETGHANGIANWGGKDSNGNSITVAAIRFDIGQIGASASWFQELGRRHDCPEGKSIYIKDILFFNSYYGAVQKRDEVHAINKSIDPTSTSYIYTVPIESQGAYVYPVTTLYYDDLYYVIDSSTTDPTVADTFTPLS